MPTLRRRDRTIPPPVRLEPGVGGMDAAVLGAIHAGARVEGAVECRGRRLVVLRQRDLPALRALPAGVPPGAGLLLLVAPDPGVGSHSRDRDPRDWAARRQVPCLEPGGLQEAYDMAFGAFELSERFLLPVVLRMVGRLAAREGSVRVRTVAGPPAPRPGPTWLREELRGYLARSGHSPLTPSREGSGMAVITAGITRRDYLRCAGELSLRPWHLHVGAYPFPAGAIDRLAGECDTLLVIEEGYPFLERGLREMVAGDLRVLGRETGTLPPGRDPTVARIRQALDLPPTSREAGEEDCDADPTD